jgi:CHASE2 domain-containing sensor protein
MLKVLLSWPARVGLTIFLGIVFVFLCFQFQWFGLVDLKIYDLGLYLRPQAEFQSDVVVVAIDRYSRENCFSLPHFPVSNHIPEHGRIIDRLSDAGAKVIAFDILFDQLDSESDLKPLVSALNKAKNVILAGVTEAQSLKVKGSSSSIREERVILPVPGIPSSSYQLGLVNVPVGPDQVARQSYYGKEFQGKWYPSFPAAVAKAFLGDGAPSWEIAEPFFIDYSSPQMGITTIRYADVLESNGWESIVKGRVALIGVTENGLGDTHKSPLPDLLGAASGNKLPGVFFLAYAAETLLRNRLTTMPPSHLSFLLGIFLVAISSMLALGKRHLLNLILIIILIMVILICGSALTALSITILPREN